MEEPRLEHGQGRNEIAVRLARARQSGHLCDMIYGGVEGAMTALPVVAGVNGAGLAPKVIITLGIDMMLMGEYGLSPDPPAPLPAALATFRAFLLAGLVPLLPFLLALDSALQVTATLAIFLVIGAKRSKGSLHPWWRTSLETLATGGTVALIAFSVGRLFHV